MVKVFTGYNGHYFKINMESITATFGHNQTIALASLEHQNILIDPSTIQRSKFGCVGSINKQIRVGNR